MTFAQEADQDRVFLDQAISLSRRALEDDGKTPFGAVVVVDGDVVGRGSSSVLERHDPTAHAEIMALRDAGRRLGRHLLEDGVLYTSSEPCPMCLCACWWARVPRLVYAATGEDVAASGFPDLRYYREMALPNDRRGLLDEVPVGGPSRSAATRTLVQWAARS